MPSPIRLGVPLLGAAILLSACGSSEKTIKLTETGETNFVSMAKPGARYTGGAIQTGGGLVIQQPYMVDRKVIVAGGHCVATLGGRTFEDSILLCDQVLPLPRGDLLITGTLKPGSRPRFAITGGTGAYAGARGQFLFGKDRITVGEEGAREGQATETPAREQDTKADEEQKGQEQKTDNPASEERGVIATAKLTDGG